MAERVKRRTSYRLGAIRMNASWSKGFRVFPKVWKENSNELFWIWLWWRGWFYV